MEIKDIIAQVRAKLPAEGIPAEVGSLLSDVIRRGDELLSDRSAANNESKTRKEKIRELESNIETLNTEITTAKTELETEKKNSEELTGFKTKWEADKTARDEKNKTQWDETAKLFDLPETDERSAQMIKLKQYYKMGDKITPEDIAFNIAKSKEHQDLGLYKVNKAEPPENPKGKGGDGSDPTKITVDPFAKR